MSGWFELSAAANGQFRFVLKAGNSQVILTSQMYASRASAEKGIASVQAHCAEDARYERLDAKDGSPYFTLKAANHQVIGNSQMYASAAARDAGIASVKENGASTQIKDMTA